MCCPPLKKKKKTELLKRPCETGPRPWLEIAGWLDICSPKSSLYGGTQVSRILDRPPAKSWLALAGLALRPNSNADTEAQACTSITPLRKDNRHFASSLSSSENWEPGNLKLKGQGKILKLTAHILNKQLESSFYVSKTKVNHCFLHFDCLWQLFFNPRCLFSYKNEI